MSSREQAVPHSGKDYVRPVLVAYGTVAALTAAGSETDQETMTGNGGCSQNARSPCRG